MTDRPDPFDQSIPLEERFPPASVTMQQWEEAFDFPVKDLDALTYAIKRLCEGPPGGHDYSTSGISMAIAARLAFNYVAAQVGATGYQASYAALHAYGKIMHINGPYGVLKAEEMLYPQHDLHGWMESWRPWLKEQAQKRLDEEPPVYASDTVVDHWRTLAAWEPEETDD